MSADDAENTGVPLFAERLQGLRKRRRWTQKALGLKAGIAPSQIAHFEAGMRLPSAFNLCRVADALGCSTDYLLGRADTLSYDRPMDTLAQTYAGLSAVSQRVVCLVADVLATEESTHEHATIGHGPW